jgi:hypothetical protein
MHRQALFSKIFGAGHALGFSVAVGTAMRDGHDASVLAEPSRGETLPA